MDWNLGYSATYYATVVDRKTWRDIRRIDITGGTIQREHTDLRESADLDCINYQESGEQIIRVWLDTKQNGDSNHTPLFTGLATSPEKNINGHIIKNTLQCYSVLKIAQDVLLQRGWYAPKGIDGGALIRELLSVIPVKVSIPEISQGLDSAILAEDGENHLSMVDKILDVMQWRMRLDGYGNVIIQPHTDIPVIMFDSLNNDVLEPTLSIEYDWYNCPNVYRALVDDSYAIARDDDPNSPLSTVSRGREVWYEEAGVCLAENQTLAEYAQSALDSAQYAATTVSYDRRYHPDVNVSDVVRLNYPEQGIEGLYLVTSQSITLQYSAKTSEEVVKI